METQSKATRTYAQSGQYHTIVESRVHLTWYQSQTPDDVPAFSLFPEGGKTRGLAVDQGRYKWYQSHALKLSRANRLVNPQISNKGLQKKGSRPSSKA